MEARFCTAAILAASVLSLGASYRTTNFVVTASTPQLAKEIGDLAEQYRRELSIEWLGRELPQWQRPCPITAQVAPNLGAGGATSFMFDRGRPFGWQMSVQGSRERVLDSVLPHEITHTIFATHFGQPLPRWADEGACTTVEHDSEKSKQHYNLIRFLKTRRGIAFNQMFAMKEYPRDVLPLYAQGYSVVRYLIAHRGKRHFVNYVGEGLRTNDWATATRNHYGHRDLSDLQVRWLDWVAKGCPAIQPAGAETLVAANGRSGGGTYREPLTARGQSPDDQMITPRNAAPAPAALLSQTPNMPATTRGGSEGWRLRQDDVNKQGPAATNEGTSVPVRPISHREPATLTAEQADSPQQPMRPSQPGRSYYDRLGQGDARLRR